MTGDSALERAKLEASTQQHRIGASAPPRVCLIALHFPEYTAKLAQALAEHGPILVVIYGDTARLELGLNFLSAFAAEGVSIVALKKPKGIFGVLSNAKRIARAVKDFGPTVIHVQEALRDELPLSLPFLPRVPMVLTIHDPEPHSGQEARSFRFSRIRLYRWFVRRWVGDAIVHGRSLVELVERRWPHLVGRVHVLSMGPYGQFPVEAEINPPASGRLLFFGRIYKYKGLGHFVGLVKALHRTGLPVTGVVAGTGPDLDPYRVEMVSAACFELRDRQIPVAEVDSLFREARVVVLPYTDGTQSGVAAMALGYGKPVVAFAVGAIPELVRNGVNGYVVAAGDAHALQDAVRSILRDDATYMRLSAGARLLRDGEFSWAAIATRTIGVYKVMLTRGRGRTARS